VLLSAYAAGSGRPQFAVVIGIVLLLLVGLGFEGTGTAMNLALSELGRLRRTVAFQEDRRRKPRVEVAPLGEDIPGVEVEEVRQ
jgi:molybdopterin/thiamine biosynthesis adenylyltransferase